MSTESDSSHVDAADWWVHGERDGQVVEWTVDAPVSRGDVGLIGSLLLTHPGVQEAALHPAPDEPPMLGPDGRHHEGFFRLNWHYEATNGVVPAHYLLHAAVDRLASQQGEAVLSSFEDVKQDEE